MTTIERWNKGQEVFAKACQMLINYPAAQCLLIQAFTLDRFADCTPEEVAGIGMQLYNIHRWGGRV